MRSRDSVGRCGTGRNGAEQGRGLVPSAARRRMSAYVCVCLRISAYLCVSVTACMVGLAKEYICATPLLPRVPSEMAHGIRPQHGAPSKYLHLHAVSERSSVLDWAKPAVAPSSDGTCTLSSSTSGASPQSAEAVDVSDGGSPPWPPPTPRRGVNLSALPADVGHALRFCDDLLLMDDGEFVITVVLAKRCLDTGLDVGPANVQVFVLSTAMLACKLQCDETYTLAEISRCSGFAEQALGSAEWYVFGWLLDHSRLAVSPSEYAACAACLFSTCPSPITPILWLVGGAAAATPRAPDRCSRARAMSAPLIVAHAGPPPSALRALSTRFLGGMGWDKHYVRPAPVAIVSRPA